VLDQEHGDHYSELFGQFQRQVNAACVAPAYITRVRRKLKLDHKQTAETFGDGVNTFSRHENGKTKLPLALVKLLKALDRHPHLLDEVKQ
jgi:HTH-type transcriptional regulator/antitoxin MqsA